LRGHQNRLGGWVGFEAPPPLAMLVGTGIIVFVYLVSAELLKPLAVAETGRAEYKSEGNRCSAGRDARHILGCTGHDRLSFFLISTG
jgi:hypothetical protein